MGEKLIVLMEPHNCVNKFAVCVEKDQTVVGHLKKEDSGKFAKRIFYFLRSDSTVRFKETMQLERWRKAASFL